MKPVRIPYADQAAVWNAAERHLRTLLSPYPGIKEAYVWASLAEGKFGTYEKQYRGQTGSDIDLVIVLTEPARIPPEWKSTLVEKSWFDLYHLGHFEYHNNKHQIDGLIVIPSKHDVERMKGHLEGRSRRII